MRNCAPVCVPSGMRCLTGFSSAVSYTHLDVYKRQLSDRIAVFNNGFIEQIGTPNEVYNHSKTEFVCNFIGDINRLEGEVADGLKLDPAQHHFVRLERIRVNRPADDNELRLDGVKMCIRDRPWRCPWR